MSCRIITVVRTAFIVIDSGDLAVVSWEAVIRAIGPKLLSENFSLRVLLKTNIAHNELEDCITLSLSMATKLAKKSQSF